MLLFTLIQAVLCFIAYTMASFEMESGLLFTGIAAAILYGIMTFQEARKERWIISPLVAYLGMSVLYVGLTPVWVYSTIFFGYKDMHFNGVLDVYYYLPAAQALDLIGVLCFYAGYKLSSTDAVRNRLNFFKKYSADFKVPLGGWLIIIGVGWAARLAVNSGLSLSFLGYINTVILDITTVAVFLIFISRIALKNDKLVILPAGWRLYLAVAVALLDLFVYAFHSGMRFPMLMLMVMFFWGYTLQREIFLRSYSPLQRIRGFIKPALLLMAAAILVITIIVPFGKRIAGGKGSPAMSEIEGVVFDMAGSFPDQGVWSFPRRLASTSMYGAGACVYLRQFLDPESKVLEQVLTGVIPRVFWPQKPFVTQGRKFYILLLGKETMQEKEATSASGMTAIGQLYWSYGLPGIIIGMMLLGAMFALSFDLFSSNMPLNPFRALATALMVMQALYWFAGDATSNFVYIIFMVVVLYPLSCLRLRWLWKLGRRSSSYRLLPSPRPSPGPGGQGPSTVLQRSSRR